MKKFLKELFCYHIKMVDKSEFSGKPKENNGNYTFTYRNYINYSHCVKCGKEFITERKIMLI